MTLLIALALAAMAPVPVARAQEHGKTGTAEKEAVSRDAPGTEAGEASGSLLPDPTSKQTYYSAVWVLIIFTITLAILYPTAWKSMLAGLKKREERIRNDIAAAEEDRRRAQATLKQYNDQLAGAEARIRDMLAKAAADGEKLATSIRMQAQAEAEEAKERAQRDIEASKNAAIREVYEQTAVLATSVAEKILRRNLNPDDQRELVRQSLEQLQTIR